MATSCARVNVKEPDASPLRGTVPPDLRELAARGLAVEGERVQFDGDLTIPPTLKGFPAVSTVRPEIVPGQRPPAEEARQRMRAMAVENPRIKEALGRRFALLSSGWLDVEKGKEETAADRYQMVFYSYDKNQVVTAIASSRGEVLDMRASTPKVQPPESREEVEAAAAIVQGDERHAARTKELQVRGIQTEGQGDHRTLYLTFYERNRRRAVYEATVDMTVGKVVRARAIQ
jgi:hypothetical protein